MKWLDMFSTKFLINIKDQVAGLSYKVPLSDHLTREFIIFQVLAVVMWISVCISRFSQIVLCLVGVKTRHGEGHIYRSIIYRIRVNVTPPPPPEVWTMQKKHQLQHLGERHSHRSWNMEKRPCLSTIWGCSNFSVTIFRKIPETYHQ